MVQEISHVNHQNNKGKRELNMQADMKMKNSKKLKVKTLVDSRCTHMGINE